ncbi:MAG: hypothetical protein K2G70_07590 [Turicibacter sp.]|nr:hypothetical protein [Turicibacter sp.]
MKAHIYKNDELCMKNANVEYFDTDGIVVADEYEDYINGGVYLSYKDGYSLRRSDFDYISVYSKEDGSFFGNVKLLTHNDTHITAINNDNGMLVEYIDMVGFILKKV